MKTREAGKQASKKKMCVAVAYSSDDDDDCDQRTAAKRNGFEDDNLTHTNTNTIL